MRVTSTAALVVAILAGTWALDRFSVEAQVNGNDNNISVMDNCDPADTEWNPTGGCTQKAQRGDVTFDEFNLFLSSPLAAAVIGPPSWRNEPSHISTAIGRSVRVTNTGGRGHTFTEVAEFGAGFIPNPNLNFGLKPAAECVNGSPVPLAPGATQVLNLSTGLHKFQCCIHPWMRATVRVQ